ncbi:prevent-host-death family protein [Streptomyces sp. WMMC500]|uniref:prevent-host-death family protein n=1 Tax=Streptomyces sp. WMMC500 TaxID=3015154 RepID=UPI00248AEB77|nr:prevent-host-death family protein [Streptomyces sp. WMMC500]WBB60095.1 prevent-host-death family protein [Streptomyces sp. WMMC500]
MESVELSDFVPDFAPAVGRVVETGQRVRVTDGGVQVRVLLAAGELAELEHFAQRTRYVRGRPRPTDERWRPLGPGEQGPYTRFVHGDGVRMTFLRGRAVVAELRSVAELEWIEEAASLGRQSFMPPSQAAAFEEFLARQPPVGDGIAWIAAGWREHEPFRVLDFVKGVAPEDVALTYGADPGDVAGGLLLHQVRERDRRAGTDDLTRVVTFGAAGEWTWLGYHDNDYAGLLDPPPTEQITLVATAAKAIYTFDYLRDGAYQNPFPVEDDTEPRRDLYELIWYAPGEMPFVPDAPLGFLNAHIRRAEETAHRTHPFELFFAGLERAFGLALPRADITAGRVRCARLTGRPARRVTGGASPA